MRRRALLHNNIEYVNLGLPSGTLWAKGNLLKSNDTWVIGNETDYGDFWSWGNVGDSSSTGYMPSSGGVMNQSMYNTTTGYQLTSDIPVDAAYDVARNRLGTLWRLPTSDEFYELFTKTDTEWATINGIKGRKFMKKSDHSVYIFFPASGYCASGGLIYCGSQGRYWSSTYCDSPRAWYLRLQEPSVYTSIDARYVGCSIRPVLDITS